LLNRYSIQLALVALALDMGLTALALGVAVDLRPDLPAIPFLQPLQSVRLPFYVYLIAPLLWTAVFLLGSVYSPRRTYKVVDELQAVTLSSAFAGVLFAGLLFLTVRDFSRYLFVLFLVINYSLHISWRLVARLIFKIHESPSARHRVLIVGTGEASRQVSQMLREFAWTGLQLVGYVGNSDQAAVDHLPVLGGLKEVRRVVERERIDDVIVALPRPSAERINQMVLALQDLPVQIRVVPDYYSLALYRATVDDFGGLPMINLRDPALNPMERLVKRLFDLVIGSALTLIALPLMAATALVIRLDSPGPILFRQKRVGENGKLFVMYKFRSMVAGAWRLQSEINEINEDGQLIHKKEDDPRVTRIGRFIRRTSLDELPQLFNVLKGDMSLVGPRPELPWLVERYEPWQRKRFAVPQGITGWWQVNGRADKPLHLHSEDDLYYIQNYSLWIDIYILLKTVWVVLRGRGAY
jgi:exopolysaccharide biosynthesis polyprenyl glycosylphosphotransferase